MKDIIQVYTCQVEYYLILGLPGELFGPGMVGGINYSPKGTSINEGAIIATLTLEDYSIIKETLRVFENELFIEQLENFSVENTQDIFN